MIRRILLSLLISCWLFSIPSVQAQKLFIPSDIKHLVLGPSLEFLEDPEGTYQLADLLQEDMSRPWQTSKQNILNFGYTNSVYWARVTLVSTAPTAQSYWLEVAYPALDDIQLYVLRPGQVPQLFRLGDHLPYSQRYVDHPSFLLPFEILPGEEVGLYLRVQSTSSVQIPFILWNKEAFVKNDYEQMLFIAVFIGIMLVMAAYNLLLFLSIRDISYFYYVLYAVSMVSLTAGIEGITFKFLWPSLPGWNDPFLVLALSGMVFFPCLFTRSFLSMPKSRPWLSRILVLVAGLSVLTAIGAFLMPYRIMIVTTTMVTLVSIAANFTAGVVRWRDGYYSARYYIQAWSFMLGGGLIMALAKLGFLPRTWLTEHAGQLGAATEILLLSFALEPHELRAAHPRSRAAGIRGSPEKIAGNADQSKPGSGPADPRPDPGAGKSQ